MTTCHRARPRTLLLTAIAALSLLATPAGAQQSTTSTDGESMTRERVLGFGGFFFRSHDPAALAAWYEEHLGVTRVPTDYNMEPWTQEAGPTVFAPFPHSTDYFGRPTQQFMLNFRVRDLDAMVAQLNAAGISVEVDPESYPNGRFASLHDPEGNPIQLWQEETPPPQ